MASSHTSVGGDPNKNSPDWKIGSSFTSKWEGELEKYKNKFELDPLTYLGSDVEVDYEEIEEASKLIYRFFEGSGVDPKELQIASKLKSIKINPQWQTIKIDPRWQTIKIDPRWQTIKIDRQCQSIKIEPKWDSIEKDSRWVSINIDSDISMIEDDRNLVSIYVDPKWELIEFNPEWMAFEIEPKLQSIEFSQRWEWMKELYKKKKYPDYDYAVNLAKIRKYKIKKTLNISEDIQLMIQHAKMGGFDTAIRILDKHQGTCLVNCIPSNRAWGLLHQAAYFNNVKAVEKILENPKCDPFLRTKITRDGVVEPGSTADKIAKDENVQKIILKHQKIRKQEMEKSSNPDLVSVEYEKDITVESIFLVINTFENVLHPKSINSQQDMLYSNLMLNVFNYINTGNNWERARKEVSLQLQTLNVFDAIFLATGKENAQITEEVLESKQDFYSRVIRLYTKECEMTGSGSSKTKTFYRALNYSLLKKGCEHSFVSGEDLALAAYGLLLNAILMYWTNLVPTNEPTYRGMELSREQLACYKEGQTLTWLCFNSSSLNQPVAEIFGNTQFICDNTQMTKYAAKGIRELSQFSTEEEFLYPSGARFRITKIERNPGGTKLWIRFEDY